MSTLTGGCQCGAIRYALEDSPEAVAICHCRMCQKAVGSILWPFFTVRREALQSMAVGLPWTVLVESLGPMLVNHRTPTPSSSNARGKLQNLPGPVKSAEMYDVRHHCRVREETRCGRLSQRP